MYGMQFRTKRIFKRLREASPVPASAHRHKKGREGDGPDIHLKRTRLRRYRGARPDSTLGETMAAALFAAVALGFFARGFGGSEPTYLSSGFAVLGAVGLIGVWCSSLRTSAKILWSIPLAAALVPYVPFL